MNSRITTTIILAVVLMVLVMGTAAFLALSGIASRDKWIAHAGWTQSAPGVQSMKVTNLNGSAKTDLFVQAGGSVLIFDESGQQTLKKDFPGTPAMTMGDVNGDGRQDILVYYKSGLGSIVTALQASGGETLWQLDLVGLGEVGRAAAIDWDGSGQYGAVIGDLSNRLVAVSSAGREVWRYDIKAGGSLRGLDTILRGKTQLIVAATDSTGLVVALDSKGQAVWTFTVSDGLRRLRTYELATPGQSAVLIGSETGALKALEGGTGQVIWSTGVGQAVTEIRLAELDGNPGTRELVVGGKEGGVWGYSQTGQQLFSASVGEKVQEIAGMDFDNSGRDQLVIGDETGNVTFFDATGRRSFSTNYSAPINRVLGDKFMGKKQFLVADASQLRALTMTRQTAPFWYSPLLAGLLACAAIAGAAWFIASIKPAPDLKLSAEEMTIEAQKARRIMLRESIEDLQKLKSSGEIPAEACLARLKDLRAQMADAEANLIKLGVPLHAETITCPNCGGTLNLGTDKCEYCGQIVIV